MRTQYGEIASKSGARIISLCGFDSIPSDLAVYTAVKALKEARTDRSVHIAEATTWHHAFGLVNGGTVHTALEMPLDLRRNLFQPVPFLLDDPLVLTNPKFREDPSSQELASQADGNHRMVQSATALQRHL